MTYDDNLMKGDGLFCQVKCRVVISRRFWVGISTGNTTIQQYVMVAGVWAKAVRPRSLIRIGSTPIVKAVHSDKYFQPELTNLLCTAKASATHYQ